MWNACCLIHEILGCVIACVIACVGVKFGCVSQYFIAQFLSLYQEQQSKYFYNMPRTLEEEEKKCPFEMVLNSIKFGCTYTYLRVGMRVFEN